MAWSRVPANWGNPSGVQRWIEIVRRCGYRTINIALMLERGQTRLIN
jgi:hypothetical protein